MREDSESDQALAILHIASGDLWAGAETQLYYLATSLMTRSDINLHIVLLNDGVLKNKLIGKGVTVTVIDESKYNSFTILIKLIRLIYQINADVIHTHRFKENILGSIASLFHRHAKCVRTIHGGSEHDNSKFHFKRNALDALNKLTEKYLAKFCVYVSHELRERLQKPDNYRYVVIENGIDFNEIGLNSTMVPSIEYSDDYKNVVFIGRMVSVKRLDIFLEIAKIIHVDATKKIRFYIVGDGPLKSEISKRIIAENLGDIVYELGFLDNPLPDLKNMNCLLVTSDHEGLPMSLLEAMYLKVLVISHNIGGITDVLEHNNSGILINSQNPDEYAEALKKVLYDDVSYNAMVSRAYDNILENYSSAGNANKYINIYKSVNR